MAAGLIVYWLLLAALLVPSLGASLLGLSRSTMRGTFAALTSDGQVRLFGHYDATDEILPMEASGHIFKQVSFFLSGVLSVSTAAPLVSAAEPCGCPVHLFLGHLPALECISLCPVPPLTGFAPLPFFCRSPWARKLSAV